MAKWIDRQSGHRKQRSAPSAPHQSDPPASSSEAPTPALSPDQLAQARQDAQRLLSDDRMVAMLPDEVVSALRGLLSPQPTPEQTQLGLAALAAVAKVMQQTVSQNPHEDEGAEKPGGSLTLDEARKLARQFLDDQRIAQRLSPEVEDALRALLAADPTEEQIAWGARALAAVTDALSGQRVSLTQEQIAKLQPQLTGWIKALNWGASRAYLQAHADALMTDEAEVALAILAQAQQTDGARQIIADHQLLLRDARAHGIDAAYDAFLRDQLESVFALLDELSTVNTEREPDRAEALCRQILAFDDIHKILTAQRRAAVLLSSGYALQAQGKRDASGAGQAALDAAIACYDLALQEYRQDNAPLDWALTQNNKGIALRNQARRLNGAAGLTALDAAIACYNLALQEYRQEVVPLQWAMTQNNKGNALRKRAERLSGAAELAALDAAIACYDLALQEYRQDNAPLDWAMTQANKGVALEERAKRLGGAIGLAALDAAIACYDLALQEYRQDNAPLDWALTQNNKGGALQERARRLSGAAELAALDAAIACYDLALRERRQEVVPLQWAMTQNNKGGALQERAERLSGTAVLTALDAAIACYDLALQEYRQEVVPLDWATAQTNKGIALEKQAKQLSGAAGLAALDAAIDCYGRALEMYPLAIQPGQHRRQTRALASVLLRRALAPASAGLAREQALDRAWAHISSALQAARDLALREALVTFRQQEWAENARVFTLAAAITALRGDATSPDEQRRRLAQAIALLEEGRARGLAEAAGRRNASLTALSELDRQRYTQSVEAVQSIEAQSRQPSDPLALQTEAQAAAEQLKQVVSEIRIQQRAQGKDFLPEPDVSLAALARGLARGEALVYLMPLEVGTLLLAVGQAGEPVMRWLGKLTSDALYDLAVHPNEAGYNVCGYLPAALGWGETPLDEALDALLPQLGDDLMRVVVEVVRQLGCQRAALIAGGLLSVMPLHAATYLPLAGEPASSPGGRRYACDDVDITYAPSGLTLLAARATAQRQARQGPAQHALVVGNPQLTQLGERWAPGSDSYLRFAEWEAQRVAALAGQRVPALQVDLQTNDAATWIAVHDGLRSADLAHLSLHARFDADNPDQSALLVAFRSHLYLRNLLQINLERLRLIVLSACQSGQSDVQRQSEEAVGLFGALLAAGTPAVIGTLWSVNDLATAHFMESFASRAYSAGVAPDAALRAAARELRGIDDALAAPAETGARPREERSIAEAPTEQPAATPARAAIAQDLAREPALAGVTRQMSVETWALTNTQVADMRGLLQRGPEHPMYWAAFVYYGAQVSLAGADIQDTLPMGAASRGERIMASDDQHDDDQRDDDQPNQSNADGISQPESSEALPIAMQRTERYASAVGQGCPRCTAAGYRPVRGADGRNLRLCDSCGLLYTLDAGLGGGQ